MQLRLLPANRQFALLDALGLAGLVGLLVARFIPVARFPLWRCEFRRLTGWPCPGCGLTRAADRLAHGNLLGALAANPVGAISGALLALCGVYMVLHLLLRLPTPDLWLNPQEARWARLVLGGVVALNYAFVIVSTRFPSVLGG
jgi:hypothetical protein